MEKVKAKVRANRIVNHPSTGEQVNGEIDINLTPDWIRLIDMGDIYIIEGKKTEEKVDNSKAADVNKDGKVDEEDLSLVHKEYAKTRKAQREKAKNNQ